LTNNTLVIIPARGGSKGIIKKNIKPLAGKPLILYTIELARSLFSDEQICVSTDSAEIKQIAENSGLHVPFLRPAVLATDKASSRDVILHAIEYYKLQKNKNYKNILLLQPTSPFRKKKHIKEALSLYSDQLDMVVSVQVTKSNPYYTLFELDNNGFLKSSKVSTYTRRQDCPVVYEITGSIYVINTNSIVSKPFSKFTKKIPYVMDEIYSIDIDTMLDWKVAESIYSEIDLLS